MADKRTTVDDIVGELRSGMTIGIGGWGSRRKPMAVVRAICRSDLTDLTVVAYGGPDVGLLCATGKVRKVVCGVRHPRLHRARSALARRAPARAGRGHGGGRGDVLPRPPGGVVARPLPAHPGRARLRRPHHQPRPATGALPLRRRPPVSWPIRPTPTSSWSPCRPSTSMPPSSTPTGPTPPGNGQVLSPDPFFDPLFLGAAERRFMTTEPSWRTATLADDGPPALQRAHPPHAGRRRGRGPGWRALHRQPARLRARRVVPEGVRRGGHRPGRVGGLRQPLRLRRRRRVPGPRGGALSAHERPRRDPGRVLRHRLRRGLARGGRGDGQPVRHHPRPRRPAGQAHLRARHRPDRRRGRADGRRAAHRHPARPSWSARRPCPTAASSTSCGRAGATS